jgi:hypothetical protein
VSALDLAARLATITGNLRSAIDAPAENLADRIKPEIDKLDACATQQDEFAGKLARAAQMVRRLRSSDVITSDGLAAKPEKQLCAPENTSGICKSDTACKGVACKGTATPSGSDHPA